MRKKIYFTHRLFIFVLKSIFIFSILLLCSDLNAQIDTVSLQVSTPEETLKTESNNFTLVDSLPKDSIKSKRKISPNALEHSVKYSSKDSIVISMVDKRFLLFQNGKVNYGDIDLEANFIEYQLNNNELYASGISDSCGHISGSPIFKQSDGEYRAQEIRYNFRTKKGKVTKVITNEGEGYIHGYYVKHVDDKTSYVKHGQYTTCNLEHPHFQIRFGKAKMIQGEKIVTGPAYMTFGNIPTPLAIPFGYFPMQKERASGIVIPTFGESTNRGFYFENFGYYIGINDNIDLLLAGDITTRGSWAVKAKSNYVFKYKCNGLIDISYAQNYFGERGTPSFYHTNDFKIYWNHKQDPKSHPTTRFSAHVDIVSSTFNKYNSSSTSDYLSNQYTSSLNLSTNANGVFYFDAALNYSQNTRTKSISMALPDMNMSVRQFYPFRKKHKAGKLKWYDNISLKWTSQMANRINTADTLFFKPETWKEIQSGMQHNIPLNIPIKIGKVLNWNTNVTLSEKWYFQRNARNFSTDSIGEQLIGSINNIFQRGFYALHDLSLSTSLTTKLYFNFAAKKGVLSARHVMSPDLSFTYRPNLGGNTYSTYFNTITGEEVEYSYFSNAMYGGVTTRTQAMARFSLNNNLEIKVRSKKDTITGTRKIPIFDNISISTGYDFAADSLRWQPLTISGRSSFFSFLEIVFRVSFDPYIINNEGKRVNQLESKVNKRGMRFSGSDLNIGLNWRLNRDFFKGKKKDKEIPDEVPKQNETVFTQNTLGMPNTRPDFTNPWSLTINYTFAYITSDNYYYYTGMINKKYNRNIVQTLNLSGEINITRKWKIGFTTGYDIQQKDFSYTSIDIYRDLHCWEMRFNWIPFGFRKGWSFTINVKASALQDLKYNLKKDFRDNY